MREDESIIEFYWEWRAKEHRITPDGLSWLDQDQAFWEDVWTFDALVNAEEQKRKKTKKGK